MHWYDEILKAVERQNWSDNINFSLEAQTTYERGLDKVNSYHGHPDPLFEAIPIFQSAQSQPYGYAGIAYILMTAAYQQSDKYDTKGLTLAQIWLEKAQKLDNGRPEINFIQLSLDICQKDKEQFLIHLAEFEPGNENYFPIQLAKLDYYCKTQSQKQTEELYERLLRLAQTPNQQRKAHRRMLQHYFWAMTAFRALGKATKEPSGDMVKRYAAKAEQIFNRMAPLSQDDPWFWHNYSLLCLATKRLWTAARYNKKALKLMQFGAALDIQAKLKKQLSFLYHLA